MARAVIGLDLSERSWKSVAVSRGLNDRLRLHGYASLPSFPFASSQLFLPASNGFSPDPVLRNQAEQFAAAMAPLAEEAAGFVVGIPEEMVTLRLLQLPFTNPAKIAQVLPLEAEAGILCDVDEMVFDFLSLGRVNGGTRVLSAAIKKNHLENLLGRLKLLAIDPIMVSPTVLSLHHLAGLMEDRELTAGRRVAFLVVGEERTEIAVAEGGRTIFAVTIPFGLLPPSFLAEMQPPQESRPAEQRDDRNGVKEEKDDALFLPAGSGIPPAGLARADQIEFSAEQQAEALSRLVPALSGVLNRVFHYLEGFSLTAHPCPPPLKRLVLLGEGANLPGLAERMTEELGVDAGRFRLDPEFLAEAPPLPEELHPALAPALALALQKVRPEGRPWINFRKGIFTFKPERQLLVRRLIFPAVLTVIFFLSLGVREWVFGSAEKKQARLARAEIEELFKEHFPDQPLVDPVAQVQQFLETAKNKQQKYEALTSPDVLTVLSAISNVIPPEIKVTFRSLDYKGERVSIYGTANKYDDPNQITKFLVQVPIFAKVDLENVQKLSEEEINFAIKIELRKGNP